MNLFQKQLMVSGKSLAELPDLDGIVYSRRILTPVRVSVEEFLTDDPDEPEVTEPDEHPMPTDDDPDESEEEDTES